MPGWRRISTPSQENLSCNQLVMSASTFLAEMLLEGRLVILHSLTSRHMSIGEHKMKTFRPARKRIEVSVGESIRIIRQLQGLSQNDLAKLYTAA